jgi:hypothetical protein
LSSRSANARVNNSGMCCTMTMPGQSGGMAVSTSRSASVPPVEAPMAITLSVVVRILCGVADPGAPTQQRSISRPKLSLVTSTRDHFASGR